MNQFPTILKALSDETRWKLIQLLLNQDLCGRALARSLDITEAAVSQHLKILKDAGLIEGEKRGYWTHYVVQKRVMEEIIDELKRMARLSAIPAGHCHGTQARKIGYQRKEVKEMCQCCCEKPEKIKSKPEECTPQQIRECHGDEKEHPCAPKKEGK